MDVASIVIPVAIVVVLVVLLALLFVVTRNTLRQLQQRVDEGWREIGALVARRGDLVSGLVSAVRVPAAHERTVFETVERADAERRAANDPAEATVAETHLQQALRSVFSTAEAYPKLTASPEFLRLQSELVDTEDRLQTSRRFYNGAVRELNTKLDVLPSSFVGRRAGIGKREFFEGGGSAIAEPPRIQF